jgi:uncharacterized protein with HEPN domain
MQRDLATLLDIVKAALLVEQFIRGYDEKKFTYDLKTQSAVIHQLAIVGEATKRLSDAFRNQNPEIPWKLIAGMRDYLIHAYDAVDLEEVWRVATRDLPDLVEKLQPLLPNESQK